MYRTYDGMEGMEHDTTDGYVMKVQTSRSETPTIEFNYYSPNSYPCLLLIECNYCSLIMAFNVS